MAKNTQNKEDKVTPVTLSDKKEKFLKAYKSSDCNVAKSCRAIKISRQTYYRWKEDQQFKDACYEIEEGLIDNAESRLQELINKGNPVAIFFYLKTKGRSRGYDERQTIDINKPFDKIELEGI